MPGKTIEELELMLRKAAADLTDAEHALRRAKEQIKKVEGEISKVKRER